MASAPLASTPTCTSGGVPQLSLRQLISAMRWDEAQMRCSAHPSEAEHVSLPLGETTLFTACRMKAPPSLVSALLDAYPDAATLRLNGSGRTPLHLACSDLRRTALGRGFDDDVEVVRLLLAARPESAASPDDDGWLPLHCACSSGPGLSSDAAAPLALVRDLLRAHPPSALTSNRGGVDPLSMLWTNSALNEEDGRVTLSAEAARFHDRIDEVERRRAALAATNPDHSRRGFAARQNSASVWARVLLLARAGYVGNVDEDEDEDDGVTEGEGAPRLRHRTFRPLHALAGIDCPTSAVEFAVRVHGNEPGRPLLTPDDDGNLPLHVAASRSCDNGDGEERRAAAVTILAEACPRAARIPNAAGRVPLNIAIDARHSWGADGGAGDVLGGGEGGGGCLRKIFEAAPEALGSRDAVSGLYPFMLAASTGSLDVSYRLLRLNPDLVTVGLK